MALGTRLVTLLSFGGWSEKTWAFINKPKHHQRTPKGAITWFKQGQQTVELSLRAHIPFGLVFWVSQKKNSVPCQRAGCIPLFFYLQIVEPKQYYPPLFLLFFVPFYHLWACKRFDFKFPKKLEKRNRIFEEKVTKATRFGNDAFPPTAREEVKPSQIFTGHYFFTVLSISSFSSNSEFIVSLLWN